MKMKRTPLYREASDYLCVLKKCPARANAGLWYNKLCNQWEEQNWTLKTGKTAWIQSVTGKPCGNSAQLQETQERYVNLVRACGGEVRVYKTVGRFVTGLGNEHPVGNGFTWHYTLGTPYLPGPSVKGVLRDWVEHWLDEPLPAETVSRLFGPKTSKAAGALIVFDALPVKPVKLEMEIMTPHYAEYYQDTGSQKPPADWYSPVPIPYLTVAGEQSFIFGLAPRSGAAVDLQLAFNRLDQALATIGAGAKTASGYGCFRVDKNHQVPAAALQPSKSLETAAAAQTLSPLRQEMEQDGYSEPNGERFMKVMTEKWLERMENSETADADRREIACSLAEWYQKNRRKDWEKPKPKSKNEVKILRIKAVLNGH